MPGAQPLPSRQVPPLTRPHRSGASPMSFARVRALVVVGVLAVAAIVFVIVALVKDSQGDEVTGDNCPAGAPRADVTLPDDPAEVTVKVYNGTNTQGLADSVTNE